MRTLQHVGTRLKNAHQRQRPKYFRSLSVTKHHHLKKDSSAQATSRKMPHGTKVHSVSVEASTSMSAKTVLRPVEDNMRKKPETTGSASVRKA